MRLNMRCVIALSALLASGCATAPDDPATVGAAPHSYEQSILQYLRENLKDPYSMRDFAIVEPPSLASCSNGEDGLRLIYHGRFAAWRGWRVAARYNAKNSFGGYVGPRTYYFWFHGEQLKGITADPSYCPKGAYAG